jgi:hypothetical protein
MSIDVRCEDAEPHMFHSHEIEVMVVCTGQTRCGEAVHERHEIWEKQAKWCNGICDCGRTDLHGPGEHK